MLNNQTRRKHVISSFFSECLFIVIIHHHKLESLLIIYFNWLRCYALVLNTTQYRNATNLRERWANCLIKDYSGSERLTYSREMLIIFTLK